MKGRFFFLQLFFLLTSSWITTAADKSATSKPTLQFSNKPPAGFEDLAAPQHTLVDVYFGDRRLLEVYATFSANSFSFDRPEEITQAIPKLINKTQVVPALSGNLEQHSELICQRPREPKGCGILTPTVAGIIFDESRFRVDIFIHPTFLEVTPLNINRYLPPTDEEAGLNSLLNLSGSVSGSSQQKLNYNLKMSGIYSYNLLRLRAASNFTSQQGFRLDNFVIEKDWQDWQTALGMFRTTPMRLLGQQEVLGLQLSSSLRMRTDLRNAYGNELTLFLPRRAFVKVFRDRDVQLLATGVYESGNQTIDTSEFPDGAYDVKIVIDDQFSEIKEEKRFFSKTSYFPPLDAPFYFAEVGFIRDRQRELMKNYPQYSRKLLAQLGVAGRFTDTFGADAGLLWVDNDYVASFGLFSMQKLLNSQFRLGGVISKSGAYGAELTGFGQYGNFSTNFEMRKFWNNNAKPRDEFTALPLPFTQASFSANYSFVQTQLGLTARWQQNNSSGFTNSSYSITPTIRQTLFRNQNFNLRLDCQYQLSSEDNVLMAMLTFEFQKQVATGLDVFANIQGKYQQDQDVFSKPVDYIANIGVNWQDGDLFAADINNKLQFSRQQERYILHDEAYYRGSYGGVFAYAEHSIPEKEGKSQTSYGSNFNVTVLGEKQGIALGGYNLRDSAIVVDLEGTPKGAFFDVLVAKIGKRQYQEQRLATAIVGQATVIPLEAYESYTVRVVAGKESFAQYDMEERQVTLYPGHIRRLIWKTSQVFILLSKLVRLDDSPVANAQIKGAIEPALTGADGSFQADVGAQSVLTVISSDTGKTCEVKLPDELAPIKGIVSLDKLICK